MPLKSPASSSFWQNLPGDLGRLCSFTNIAVDHGQELCNILQLCCLLSVVFLESVILSLRCLWAALSDCGLSASALQLGVDGGCNLSLQATHVLQLLHKIVDLLGTSLKQKTIEKSKHPSTSQTCPTNSQDCFEHPVLRALSSASANLEFTYSSPQNDRKTQSYLFYLFGGYYK